MVRDYELMYIVRPELDEEAVRAAADSVQQLVESLDGEVRKTTMWGKRRLAYEVQHLRDGYYVILKLRLEGARVKDLARNLRIHDTVFRHLLLVEEVPDGDADETGEVGAVIDADAAGGSDPAVVAPSAPEADAGDAEVDVPAADPDADEESQMAGAVAGEEG